MIDLKKLKELGEKATQGPWEGDEMSISGGYEMTKYGLVWYDIVVVDERRLSDYYSLPDNTPENVDFIVEARNNWEEIIRALEEAKKHFEEQIKDDGPFPTNQCLDFEHDWLEKYFKEGEG